MGQKQGWKKLTSISVEGNTTLCFVNCARLKRILFHFNSFLPTLPESSKVIRSTWDVGVGLLLVAASVF